MSLLRLQGVSKQIQGQVLFQGVDWTLEEGERLGVIGVNGCGKTTFLRLLAGEVECDGGTLSVAADCRVAYLPQVPRLDPELTVMEAVYLSQRQAWQLFESYQAVCGRLAEEPSDSDYREMDRLSAELERSGFHDLQVRAEMAVQHLDLAGIQHLKIGSLSGGQRRRVDLAQVLTSQPDVLLLDEPTNHLDTESVDWLEGFLRDYKGAVVMITHDRYFLDRITQRTLEIDEGVVTCYVGNYARYLEKKAELAHQAQASAAKRANLWRRELEWLRRGPKARTTKSKARIERALELQPQGEQARQKLSIDFATARLGSKVLTLQGASKAFGEKVILRNFDFVLEPGARIGIIGRNGCGKTTLLDLLSGRGQLDQGEREQGTTVKLGYFDQETRQLDPSLKVLDALREVSESIPLANGEVLTAAQMLERFLFSGRLQHTQVGRLSGGEKRRLYLLQILIGNPNVLFLDEPTNDLDIPTLSCLEDYLDSFPGCLIVSSHDRYFLDRTVESLLCFEGVGNPRPFVGGYSDYLQARPKAARMESKAATPSKAEPPARAAETAASSPPKARKLSFKEKRELEALEQSIPADEERKAELERTVAESSSNYGALREAFEALEKLKVKLAQDVDRWAELAEWAE